MHGRRIAGCCSIIIIIPFRVYKGQSCAEHTKTERIQSAMKLFSHGLDNAYARYSDFELEIVYDRKNLESYVRTKREFKAGELIICPIGPQVKVRTIKYGEQISFLDSQLATLEDGNIIVCSPIERKLTLGTAMTSRVDRFV